MRSSGRRELELRLRAELEAATSCLVNGQEDKTSEHVQRVEMYTRLLNAWRSHSRDRRLWGAGIGVGCLFLISLLASVRAADTRVLLDVHSSSAVFQLARPLDWSGDLALVSRPVRVEGLSTIDAPFLGAPIKSIDHESWIDIDGGTVTLSRLQIADAGIVQFEQTPAIGFRTFVREGEVRGTLQLLGDLNVRIGGAPAPPETARPVRASIPESIGFIRQRDGIVPMTLRGSLDGEWFLKDVPVRMLAFDREVPGEPGTTRFTSTLKRGSLALPEVGRQVALRERDHLTLEGADGLLVELRADSDGIHLLFQGRAAGIRLGPSGFSENLVPTYLEYLYRSQPLALFWGAATFLGGLLWAVRRTFLE